jgi:diguanylate cyclase (GGDEF)-like protein/PAS domain S-box-containing protein
MSLPAKILVVDDQSVLLKLTLRVLDNAGYETFGAEDGATGLRLARTHKPDLILLDVDLPDMSGLEVCRQIKSDAELNDAFIIMLSGTHADSDSQAAGLDIGADEYLVRPIANRELIARVRAMLRIRSAEVARRAAQAEAESLLRQSEHTRFSLLSLLEDQKQVEEALRASEQRYRNLFERVPVGLYRTTLDGRILDANQALAHMLGYADPAALLEVSALALFPDPAGRAQELALLMRDGIVRRFELQLRRADGSAISVWDTTRIIRDDEGRILYQEGSLEDITERKQTEQELADERNLLRTLIDILPDIIYAKDTESRFVLANAALAASFGKATPGEILGSTDFAFHPPESAAQFHTAEQELFDTGQPLVNREEQVLSATEGRRWLSTTKVPWRDNAGRIIGLVGIGHDITERKAMESLLQSLSLTDELTGLYNRRGFMLLAEQQLKVAHRTKVGVSLLFGDVDCLKPINDALGHAQGDQALTDIAGVLQETFRESDIIARLGGDEFVVLVQDSAEEKAHPALARVEENLAEHTARGDRDYQLAVSFGVARYDPEAPCTVADLIAQADSAMYRQKQLRKARKTGTPVYSEPLRTR